MTKCPKCQREITEKDGMNWKNVSTSQVVDGNVIYTQHCEHKCCPDILCFKCGETISDFSNARQGATGAWLHKECPAGTNPEMQKAYDEIQAQALRECEKEESQYNEKFSLLAGI